MEIRKFLICFVFTCVTTICLVDSLAFHKRVRWIALGEEIKEGENLSWASDLDNYNVSMSVTREAAVMFVAIKGKRINSIIACASKLKGYVSLENGGLEESHVTIKYVTENGEPDDFFVSIQSYRPVPLVLNDNLASAGNIAVVIDDIRNWTRNIQQETAISDDYT